MAPVADGHWIRTRTGVAADRHPGARVRYTFNLALLRAIMIWPETAVLLVRN
ncbi:MAG: hypothetical protein RLY86_4384 [Pseudomonadota bacterium]|jgi:hypothetical protein